MRKELCVLLLPLIFLFYAPYLYYSQEFLPSPSRNIEDNTIGCIFPLSGKYELVGRKALKGALVASHFFDSQVGDVQVVVRDSGSTSEELTEAFEGIVSVDHVPVVVGPILSNYIKDISGSVKSLQIPTVVFPLSSEDASKTNPFLIEFSYSLEKQARVLARYAATDVGIGSFGILYPKTRLGELSKEAFIRAIRESGGNVIYVGSYNPKLPDISKEINWMKARNPSAIFIPDNATNAAQLILRLKQDRELGDSTFLGLNSWNSDMFLKAVGKTDRIVLTDFFFSGTDMWQDFKNRYKASFNEEPGFLEYQIYEAVNLMLSVIEPPVTDRREIIDRLLALKVGSNFDINQNPGGGLEISPKPLVLMVANGVLVRVK